MKFLALHENKNRGRFDFPLEIYNDITPAHTRYEMPFHWHTECEFIQVISGEFSLSVHDHTIVLTAGESAFIPSDSIHGGTPNNCSYQCLVFSLDNIIGTNPARQKQYDSAMEQTPSKIIKYKHNEKIQQLFQHMKKEQNGYEFIVLGLIWQIVGDMIYETFDQENAFPIANHNKQIYKIKNVLKMIRNQYPESLTLEMLADESGLNVQYFCKYFKNIIGKTPIDYLNYYRIECAAEILKTTDRRVTEVALDCGFNDLSYFIKLFKRNKGVSPRVYRNNNA